MATKLLDRAAEAGGEFSTSSIGRRHDLRMAQIDFARPVFPGTAGETLDIAFRQPTSSAYETSERLTAIRTQPPTVPSTPSSNIEQPGSIRELREISALTADQIGRLFGVSRRSVQNWIAGASMASRHEERLAELLLRIRKLGSTPTERRRALLRSSAGPSPFQLLLEEAAVGEQIQWPSHLARDLLGA